MGNGYSNIKYEMCGKTYGYRTVISEGIYKGGRNMLLCRCICGNEKYIILGTLRDGSSKSCGCKRKELSSKSRGCHCLSSTRFYRIFIGARERCNNIKNERYYDYGGRGIKFLWNSFEEFMVDMYKLYLKHIEEYGLKQTQIDRINNDGNYCKENCRWVTPKENANNTRKSNIKCSIEGCNNKHSSKGYCPKHYYKYCGGKEKRRIRCIIKNKEKCL